MNTVNNGKANWHYFVLQKNCAAIALLLIEPHDCDANKIDSTTAQGYHHRKVYAELYDGLPWIVSEIDNNIGLFNVSTLN